MLNGVGDKFSLFFNKFTIVTKALVEELAFATEMPDGFSSAFSVCFFTTLENLIFYKETILMFQSIHTYGIGLFVV